MDKNKILEVFLKKNDLCVFSSVSSDGFPQSAVLSFTEIEDLSIIISTLNTTRKYKNIKSNPKSSVVIGWNPSDFITLQMDGTTEEPEDQEKYKQLFIVKHPGSLEYLKKPGNTFLVFKPSWIKYSDIQSNVIFEL